MRGDERRTIAALRVALDRERAPHVGGVEVLQALLAVEELGVTVHFVKENTILSADSRSSEKLMHNIKVAIARNYVDNLSEEVKKGLREKAERPLPWRSSGRLCEQSDNTAH